MKKWLCGLMSLALALCIGVPGGGLSALAFAGDAAAISNGGEAGSVGDAPSEDSPSEQGEGVGDASVASPAGESADAGAREDAVALAPLGEGALAPVEPLSMQPMGSPAPGQTLK